MLVAISKMILAELASGVTDGFEQIGNCRHPVCDSMRRARHADREQPGADGMLTEDKGCAPRGTGLLTVSVGKKRAFLCETVDVGGTVSHHAEVVTTKIRPTDVVAPDDQDVRFLLLLLCHLMFLSFF